MSRPIIPTFTVPGWTIPTWAPDASYPAGASPWNGQPTKVVHAGASTVGFTPKQPVSAQAMNYLVNAAYDVDGEAKTHATTLTSEVQSFAEDVVEYTGQLPALNFRPTVSITDARAAAWDVSTLSWWVADHAGPQLKRSRDSGDTFGTVSVSGVQPSDIVVDMAFDGSGNGVAAIANASAGANYIWECTAETWTRRQISAFGTTSDSASVAYDADTGRFIVAQTRTTNACTVAHSTDRTTWTAGTLPASCSTGIYYNALATNGEGRILLVAVGAGEIFVTVSIDGGSTFTDLVDFAASSAQGVRVTHVRGTTWLIALGATGESQVFRSTDDGATWTEVADLSTLWIRGVVVMGGLLVGVGTKTAFTGPVYSTDDGETWKYGNHVVEASADHGYIAAGGGQVCLVADGGAAMSLRVGDSGEPVS